MAPVKCNLCKSQPADKANSHIIPKFLCKGLFESVMPRHTLTLDRTGKGVKEQDTPKEDNILCANCEKRIGILETYFALRVNEIHNYTINPDKFVLRKTNGQESIECQAIHPTLFKLFIYSLTWRVSISSLPEYKHYVLPEPVEEELRHFLDVNLSLAHKTLLESVNSRVQIPAYHSCMLMPKQKARGILAAYNMSHHAHLLMLVNFGLFFYTDEDSIGPTLVGYSNKQNDKVVIGIGSNEAWQDLNKQIVARMLNSENNNGK